MVRQRFSTNDSARKVDLPTPTAEPGQSLASALPEPEDQMALC